MAVGKKNCCDVVFQYLKNENRPYGVNDIVQNLHNKFSKSAVQKALDELTADEKIKEKIYGKQKIYSIKQVFEYKASTYFSHIKELDENIERACSELKTLQEEFKTIELELKLVESQPTTKNVICEMHELQTTVKNLEEKVNNLTEFAPAPAFTYDEEERKQLQNAYEKFFNEHKKRKNMCMNIIYSILESYPKKIKFLLEEIGIEIEDLI